MFESLELRDIVLFILSGAGAGVVIGMFASLPPRAVQRPRIPAPRSSAREPGVGDGVLGILAILGALGALASLARGTGNAPKGSDR